MARSNEDEYPTSFGSQDYFISMNTAKSVLLSRDGCLHYIISERGRPVPLMTAYDCAYPDSELANSHKRPSTIPGIISIIMCTYNLSYTTVDYLIMNELIMHNIS